MRTLSRIKWTLAAALLVQGALAGCAGHIEASDPNNTDEQVYQRIEELGHARDNVVMNGNYVVVEGDIAYEREALLAGDYDLGTADAADEDEDVVQKGWAFPRAMTSATRKNIKLAFLTGAEAPNATIKAAFRAAAADWSAAKNAAGKLTDVKISEANTGSTITVRMVPNASWLDRTPCGSRTARACSEPFRKTKPSANVYIMTDPGVGCNEGWSPTLLANVTRHELGHTIGFAHPGDTITESPSGAKAAVVAGTCKTFPCDTSGLKATTTVMKSVTMGWGQCTISPSALQIDDKNTVVAMYPKP